MLCAYCLVNRYVCLTQRCIQLLQTARAILLDIGICFDSNFKSPSRYKVCILTKLLLTAELVNIGQHTVKFPNRTCT
jgi:hypothetical protein